MGLPDLSVALHAARCGDDAGFFVLYQAVHPGLLRYLRLLVGNEAEDVASETWLQIARDLGGFAGEIDEFRGWAATVARHRAMDHLRKLRRRPPSVHDGEQLVDLASGDDTEQDALDAISTDAALALIARLAPDQAEVVLLRAVVGLDVKRTAEVLGKRPGAVRTAAYRGLNRLAEHLADVPVTDPRLSTLKGVR